MELKEAELFIPCLPENAPFSPEQRAYLNGFLAGLFSRTAAAAAMHNPTASPEQLVPLSILFGSQTGNAESLAKRVAKEAGKRGFAATAHELNKYPVPQLASDERVLIITSTFGDGEPPDNAKAFWEFLADDSAPKLPKTRFSVCALGDSNYPRFCGFGKDLDARLELLGAQRVLGRTDCDVDFEEPFAKWLNEALSKIGATPCSVAAVPPASGGVSPQVHGHEARAAAPHTNGSHSGSTDNLLPALPAPRDSSVSNYSRANPFPAVLITNRKLNGPGSEKDTRHFEIALENSELSYEAGDALGVFPRNCPDLVDEILSALKCSGDEPVYGRDGGEVQLSEALLRHYEITKIPAAFLKTIAERTDDDFLKKLASPNVNGELSQFLRGREIIDLLLAHPNLKFSPAEFVALLKRLQPRLYSISSSPKAHPEHVHLTVNVVRYDSLARSRKGVCSTFLADRAESAVPLPIFVQKNQNFRPPKINDAPIIMVGPGTGIAPFRAFLQERHAMGAKGKNWLFFGDQRAATDFLYRDELETMQRAGVLSRLDLAFSRDQAAKIYVQHRMRENARELFSWLESGAHFYVCGDAARMAKDVDTGLHEVIQTGASVTMEKAAEYVANMKAQNRYLRDVY
jgi:sulfite reductase (NADPH) flavoprotein alpha-component